ncbi:MAG: hypothetical protein V2A66_01165, partial [Pseudomonadota bacterium]
MKCTWSAAKLATALRLGEPTFIEDSFHDLQLAYGTHARHMEGNRQALQSVYADRYATLIQAGLLNHAGIRDEVMMGIEDAKKNWVASFSGDPVTQNLIEAEHSFMFTQTGYEDVQRLYRSALAGMKADDPRRAFVEQKLGQTPKLQQAFEKTAAELATLSLIGQISDLHSTSVMQGAESDFVRKKEEFFAQGRRALAGEIRGLLVSGRAKSSKEAIDIIE